MVKKNGRGDPIGHPPGVKSSLSPPRRETGKLRETARLLTSGQVCHLDISVSRPQLFSKSPWRDEDDRSSLVCRDAPDAQTHGVVLIDPILIGIGGGVPPQHPALRLFRRGQRGPIGIDETHQGLVIADVGIVREGVADAIGRVARDRGPYRFHRSYRSGNARLSPAGDKVRYGNDRRQQAKQTHPDRHSEGWTPPHRCLPSLVPETLL